MSNPYGNDDIEVMDQWNDILSRCGNCLMPTYSAPSTMFESITVLASFYFMPAWFVGLTKEEKCKQFRTIRRSHTNSSHETSDNDYASTTTSSNFSKTSLTTIPLPDEDGFSTFTSINTANIYSDYSTTLNDPPEGEDATSSGSTTYSSSNASGSCIGTVTITSSEEGGGSSGPWNSCETLDFNVGPEWTYEGDGLFSYVNPDDDSGEPERKETEYLDEFNYLDWLAEKSWEDEDQQIGNRVRATLECNGATKIRFKWEASPTSPTDSYLRVIWDVIEEPDGWDDENPTVERSWVSQDNTWVWDGPAILDGDNGYLLSSLRSDFYYIDAPEVVGTRRVVNVRYDNGQTPYGSLPMVLGEGIELPPP